MVTTQKKADMVIERLRELVDIAETLSFSKTAKRLYLSESTLSRHVFSIEQELGIRLFERDSRSMKLTTAGELFCKNVRELLAFYDDTVDMTVQLGKDVSPRLTVACYFSFVERYVEPVVTLMAEQGTPCGYELLPLWSNDAINAVAKGTADLGIGVVPPAEKGVDGIVCGTERLLGIVNRNDPLADREMMDARELSNRELVIVSGYAPWSEEHIGRKVAVGSKGQGIHSSWTEASRAAAGGIRSTYPRR